jgi:hypothetical protein
MAVVKKNAKASATLSLVQPTVKRAKNKRATALPEPSLPDDAELLQWPSLGEWLADDR